ncbi:MAG: ribosome small subunit-dependent GTPase A [Oscillospiraceae bacterium]|nr:ribosome small subunit-dependent GTPase A [Oscillospiraceae bacterium]
MEYKIVNGLVIGASSGLYDVESEGGAQIVQCKPRGVFRKNEQTINVGDRVNVTYDDVISEVLERKNSIIRPPLSNLDILFFVVSSCEPSPNFLLLDKFLAVASHKSITPVIVLTKLDLKAAQDIIDIYSKTNIRIICVDYSSQKTKDEILALMSGKISAFTGNSGVGKSTLLNYLGNFGITTAQISKKLGRGRHTTRSVSLFKLPCGGYVADTPGFSTFDTNRYDIIKKDELAFCFEEFEQFSHACRFRDCSHTTELGCKVIEAVNKGLISKCRHSSYCTMYDEAKQLKDWEI